MGANHRKKAVRRFLGLKQVGRGKFRVVSHWIGAANLELNPEAKAVVDPFEHDICAGRVTE
jgi:hypothetical protein